MASLQDAKFEKQLLPEPEGILPPGSTAECQLGHSVVNLSNLTLSQAQIEVLQKGLTFCPTPGTPDITEIWNDLEDFF